MTAIPLPVIDICLCFRLYDMSFSLINVSIYNSENDELCLYIGSKVNFESHYSGYYKLENTCGIVDMKLVMDLTNIESSLHCASTLSKIKS